MELVIHTITTHTHKDQHNPSTAIMLKTTNTPAERGKDIEKKSEVYVIWAKKSIHESSPSVRSFNL